MLQLALIYSRISIAKIANAANYSSYSSKVIQKFATMANKPQTQTQAFPSIKESKDPIPSPTLPPDPVDISKSNLDLSVGVRPAVADDFVKIHYQPTIELDKTTTSSFDEIPGPVTLNYLAKIWKALPIIGTQVTSTAVQYLLSTGSQLNWGEGNARIFKYLLDQYGPIVRLYGPFGGDVVILSRPEHVAEVFTHEGPFPVRSSLDCVEKYRLEHRKYKNSGIFLLSGPEWQKFRSLVDQPIQSSIIQQFDKIDKACDDFITRLVSIRNKQQEVPNSFDYEIYKWCLECLCVVVSNKKMGFLDPCGLSSTSDPGLLLDGLIGATRAIQRCEYGLHFWKFFKTPAFNSLVYNCDTIDNILTKHIERAAISLRDKKDSNNQNLSLLETMLLSKGIITEDILTILLDMLLIGVNTVSHAVAFLFYYLARSPRSQVKLFEEINRQPIKFSKDILTSMPYLQACIKECLRLKPPIPILGRMLSNDINVHHYHIPKGTYLVMVPFLSSLREEHFEDPLKFLPERWTSGSLDSSSLFASMPFGYGAKACLAKELAEIEIGLLLCKVLKKFRIEYYYGDIGSTNKMLSAPDRFLKFRFVDRA